MTFFKPSGRFEAAVAVEAYRRAGTESPALSLYTEGRSAIVITRKPNSHWKISDTREERGGYQIESIEGRKL
jgi:hypothetical protein